MRNSVTSARTATRQRPSGSLAGRNAFPVTVAQRAACRVACRYATLIPATTAMKVTPYAAATP
jgi:hypothetical protein